MHFVNCLDCDEDVIIFDVKPERGGFVCKDGCLKSYERAGVPIRIHAANIPLADIDKARTQVLAALKSLGKPKEVALILQNPVTAAELTEALREAGATVGRVVYDETDENVGAGVPNKTYTREVAASAAEKARKQSMEAPTQPLRVVKTPSDEPAADAFAAGLAAQKKDIEHVQDRVKGLVDAFTKLASEGDALEQLEKEHGFTKPEDGSEQRYAERITKMSRARHQFWWLVHNNVAHPLIGLVPRRFAFKFHDWTSRKLHGQ